MDSLNQPNPGLGSLAQASRTKELKTARWILIIVGILSVLVQGYQYMNAEKLVEDALQAELKKQNMVVVDQELYKTEKAKIVKANKLIFGISAVLGVVLIGCGMVVYNAPVAATLTGLIIYAGSYAAFAMLNPENLYRGIILKVIIIVCLVKAVQAAIAYQKETNATAAAPLA